MLCALVYPALSYWKRCEKRESELFPFRSRRHTRNHDSLLAERAGDKGTSEDKNKNKK